MLPGMPGLDVLRRLRTTSDVPVIILTARGEEVERILGLEVGADDYLAKPFSPRELIARMRAILRRTNRATGEVTIPTVAGITMNSAAREAWLNNIKLNLTGVEFSLLEVFVSHAGRVVSRELLTRTVLGRELGAFDRVIDVHVSKLRKKLGSSDAGERIKAVRGSGYLFVVRPEPA
jgi:two-component system response regulator CpxR